MFTNTNMTSKELAHYYFAKDLIERCLRLSKSVLNLNPISVQLDKNILTHVMICCFGLALLTTIRFTIPGTRVAQP